MASNTFSPPLPTHTSKRRLVQSEQDEDSVIINVVAPAPPKPMDQILSADAPEDTAGVVRRSSRASKAPARLGVLFEPIAATVAAVVKPAL